MYIGCSLDSSKAPTKIFLKTLRGKIDRSIKVRARLNGYAMLEAGKMQSLENGKEEFP